MCSGTPPDTLSTLQRRVLAAGEATPTPTQLILGRVGEGPWVPSRWLSTIFSASAG